MEKTWGTELVESLRKSQQEFPVIVKSKPVKVKTAKGEYTFMFAPLDQIKAATEPVLHANGLVVSQMPDGESLKTILIHEATGQYIESSGDIGRMGGDPQSYGSKITFMRRYAYSAILGLVTEDDDDGRREARAPATPKPAADAPQAEWRGYLRKISKGKQPWIEAITKAAAELGVSGDEDDWKGVYNKVKLSLGKI